MLVIFADGEKNGLPVVPCVVEVFVVEPLGVLLTTGACRREGPGNGSSTSKELGERASKVRGLLGPGLAFRLITKMSWRHASLIAKNSASEGRYSAH
jgi:hypothetical protein